MRKKNGRGSRINAHARKNGGKSRARDSSARTDIICKPLWPQALVSIHVYSAISGPTIGKRDKGEGVSGPARKVGCALVGSYELDELRV